MNKIKICYLREGKTGVDYWRIEIPFNNLNDNYKDLEIRGTNSFTHEFPPEQFDIIVLNRASRCDVDYILRAKENGVKVILDLDDWIELPNWHGSHHGIYTPEIEKMVKRNIELADIIWCASEYLDKLLGYSSSYGNRIIYIPNAIDFSQPQFIPQPQIKERYTIGYIAGHSHQNDISKLMIPLQKLFPQKNYDMLAAGYTKDGNQDYWNYVTQIFTSNAALPLSRFKKIDAYDCYNYAVSYNLCDLMLAPLANDTFSKCKSNIKVLEAGAFSLPIICSNEEPYKEFIKLGLVYSSDGNWDGRIKDLIKNPQKGRNIGKALNEYIHTHYDINIINKNRYESIINLINK